MFERVVFPALKTFRVISMHVGDKCKVIKVKQNKTRLGINAMGCSFTVLGYINSIHFNVFKKDTHRTTHDRL